MSRKSGYRFSDQHVRSQQMFLKRAAVLALPTPYLRPHDALMTLQPHDSAPATALTCLQCGTAFECRPTGGCWCAAETFRLPMPPPGEACLCPDCLRALAARGRPPTA